jgi:hypothetical protein
MTYNEALQCLSITVILASGPAHAQNLNNDARHRFSLYLAELSTCYAFDLVIGGCIAGTSDPNSAEISQRYIRNADTLKEIIDTISKVTGVTPEIAQATSDIAAGMENSCKNFPTIVHKYLDRCVPMKQLLDRVRRMLPAPDK